MMMIMIIIIVIIMMMIILIMIIETENIQLRFLQRTKKIDLNEIHINLLFVKVAVGRSQRCL